MRYVVAVCDEGGFEAAARALHMSQPPLSRQIRDLERELGVALFHRRPTRLTEAGRVFVEAARQILSDVDSAVERTRTAGLADTGTVRLGYTVTTAFYEMPSLFAACRERYPGIRLDAREGWDGALVAAFADGALDALLGRCLPATFEAERITLRRDRLAVVVAAAHPVAGRESVALRQLRGETWRFFPRSFAPHYHDAITSAVRGTGEAFDTWENPLPGLRNLAVSLRRTGFMLLPRSVGDQLPAGLACVPVDDDLPTVDLELLWRTGSAPATLAVVGTARDLAGRLGWLAPGHSSSSPSSSSSSSRRNR